MSVQDLLKRLTADQASIAAFTLLSETVGAREFVRALDNRLRSAEAGDKLAFWCLIDSLLKQGRDELKEHLLKALPGYVVRQIPWELKEDVPKYTSIIHSWEECLPADVMADVEHAVKDSLFQVGVKETKSRTDSKMHRRALFRAIAPAAIPAIRKRAAAKLLEAHWRSTLSIGEQLLVTVPTETRRGRRGGRDGRPDADAAAAATEGADGEVAGDGEDHALPTADTEGDVVMADADDADAVLSMLPRPVVVHTTADELDIHNTASIIRPMYNLGTMCPSTGFRFTEPNCMGDHKDNVMQFKNTDERVRKCRVWNYKPEDWCRIDNTRFGHHSFQSRDKLVGMAAPATNDTRSLHAVHTEKNSRKRVASAVTPDLIKVSDPSQIHRCVLCQDAFDKRVLHGEWYLVDAMKIKNMKDPTKPWRRVTGVAHTSCGEDV